MKLPDISVIVPVYNAEQYVERAINSICRQTKRNIEIIIIDDGSSDGSADKCRKIADIDPRIHLIEMDHQGVSVAKNKGLDAAKGKYISFIDSDDWIDEDMLEYLYGHAQSSGTDISTCEVIKEYPGGKSKKEGSHRNGNADWVRVTNEINFGGEFTAYLVNKLFKKELLDNVRFRPGATIGEDYCFLMRVMMRKPSIIRGGEGKYHYMQHAGSVSYLGYSNPQSVYRNRANYRETYKKLSAFDMRLQDGALAYYLLQEMAVIISMVKAHHYDKKTAKSIQRTIRRYLPSYLLICNVPLYLKGCAILLSIHEYMLIIPYKIVFHRSRSVTE